MRTAANAQFVCRGCQGSTHGSSQWTWGKDQGFHVPLEDIAIQQGNTIPSGPLGRHTLDFSGTNPDKSVEAVPEKVEPSPPQQNMISISVNTY